MFLIGKTIGRYQIQGLLGQGGMATVYKAFDTRLDREVAIKVIRRDAFPPDQMDMLLKRFERESKSLAKLSHPNIVGVMDYGEYEGSPYLVMEYLSGGTLKDRLGKPMPWREAVQMILPIANALDYVHDHNIINRDVKPSNVLMTEKGQPMLTDFGLVKIYGEETKESTQLTGSSTGIGTPDYMAPEQWVGETTAQSDLYSLGVILYEMITGHRPYTADTPAGVMLKQATEPLPLPKRYVPDLPGQVESVLLKSLAKQPRDRYPTVHEFIDDLQNLLAGREVFASRTNVDTLREKMIGISPAETLVVDQSRPASSPVSIPAPSKKRTWPILAGVGAFVLIAACGAFLLLNAGSFLNLVAPTQTAIVEVIPASTNTEAPPTETLEAPATIAPTETEAIVIPTDTPFLTEIQDERNVTMVYIPPGEFTMGSKTSGDVNNQIEQTINLDGFYIDKYEVTNEMYDACSFAVECRRPLQFGSATRSSYFQNPVYAKYPVVFVDWKMANAYCEWRGARLPTEAEWEKAAGGTDDRIYPWGSNNPDCSFGNMPGCNGDTTPVDQYGTGVSPYGVFGMAGNVLEWTSSLFLPYPYDATDGREDPKAITPRVLRGGSWHSGIGGNVRVDTREALDPASNTSYIGIRCAKSATP